MEALSFVFAIIVITIKLMILTIQYNVFKKPQLCQDKDKAKYNYNKSIKNKDIIMTWNNYINYKYV